MKAIQLKKDSFFIKRTIPVSTVFDQWLEREGRIVAFNTKKNLRLRWFCGGYRAKTSLYRAVKTALHARAPFSRKLEIHLNHLPAVIRSIAIDLVQRGFKDLYSVDANQALVVVPRGMIQHEFNRYLLKDMTEAPELAFFPGLSPLLLKECGTETERLLFEYIHKGKVFTDPDCKGLLLAVDNRCPWKLNGIDGHYYYAFSVRQGKHLNGKKELKQLKSEMEDVLVGQQRYMKTLALHQIFDIAQGIRALRSKQSCTG